MQNLTEIIINSITDRSLLTNEVRESIIFKLSNNFHIIFPDSDKDLMFVLNSISTYDKSIEFNYIFKYGSVSIENVFDKILIIFQLNKKELNLLNIPLNKSRFSIFVNSSLEYEHAYFSREFDINDKFSNSSLFSLQLEHLRFNNRSTYDIILAPSDIDYKLFKNSLLPLYSSSDDEFYDLLVRFLDLFEKKNNLLIDIFPDYFHELDLMNTPSDISGFLNLVASEYTHYKYTLTQKILLAEMILIC